MTFEEYAIKNIREMEQHEPTAQNMRDIALLELWLTFKDKEYNSSPTIENAQIVKETRDILPAYFDYVESKRKYQLREATEEKVLNCLSVLSDELKDLFRLIYRNTDTPEERQILNTLINEINVGNI